MGIHGIDQLHDKPDDDEAPDANEPGDKVNHEIAALLTPQSETLVPDKVDQPDPEDQVTSNE